MSGSDARALSGPQKAATIMLALGEAQASALFARMHEDEIRDVSVVLLCHIALTCVCCFCRQQGQRGRRRTRPTVRRRRMLAIECGTCRSGRTGTARPETLG